MHFAIFEKRGKQQGSTFSFLTKGSCLFELRVWEFFVVVVVVVDVAKEWELGQFYSVVC